jgi:hypothetical protein
MSILISKFNSSGVLYDALSGEEYNLDFKNYISVCYNDDYVYFLRKENPGKVLQYDLLTEEVKLIRYESTSSDKSIVFDKGKIYGFDGYKAKKYDDYGVLYIKNSTDNKPAFLAYERFNRSPIYKSGANTNTVLPLLYSKTQIEDFIIDDDLSYIVLHYVVINKNEIISRKIPRISKFNKYRELIYTIDVSSATTTAIQNLSVLPNEEFKGLKLDFVREFTTDGIKKYPILLACREIPDRRMFLAKIDEENKDITLAKYIGLSATDLDYDGIDNVNKPNYNLTNYDFLRRKYTKQNVITFKALLVNIYNNRDTSDIEIEVDISKFKTEWHHFAFRLDSVNGKIDVLCDGMLVAEKTFDSGKYIFQDIFSESFNVGNTYMTNNISLDDFINQKGYYYVNNLVMKQFKVYQKYLTNNQVDFLIYNGIKMEDLVVSLPCDQRNHLDGVERQFKFVVPGNKSNYINIHLKNSTIKVPLLKGNVSDMIVQEIQKTIPASTQINNINYRNANQI